MKVNKLTVLAILSSLCLVPGCKTNNENSNNINFITGYEDFVIESQKPNSNGKVDKPNVENNSYTVYGYY